MIGMSYQKKGEKEKGVALCDKAIEMDPVLQSTNRRNQCRECKSICIKELKPPFCGGFLLCSQLMNYYLALLRRTLVLFY